MTLFFLGFIAVGFHSLFMGIRIEVAAFVFLPTAARAFRDGHLGGATLFLLAAIAILRVLLLFFRLFFL